MSCAKRDCEHYLVDYCCLDCIHGQTYLRDYYKPKRHIHTVVTSVTAATEEDARGQLRRQVVDRGWGMLERIECLTRGEGDEWAATLLCSLPREVDA